jgi:zinc protease
VLLHRFPLLAALALVPSLAGALELPVAERTLKNGLTVLVHEDHSAPVVSSYVFYHSGSRNELRGQTGIAHLFEHMMFNGGKKFGPGVFDGLIEGNGGSTNGYTTRDYTAYLNNFPREALPVVLDLESDRMGNLAITAQNLEQERGIVAEERRLRLDNDIEGTMDEELYLHAFEESSYRWEVLGFMADIQRITLDQARAYFRTYYAPNNATLVLAGDVEPRAAFALAERYFGKIPRHPPPVPIENHEPEQQGERRVIVRKPAELPALLIGYHGVRAADPDRAALDVIEKLLGGGESARLNEDMVRRQEVATNAAANNASGIEPDLFLLYAQARPGKTTAALEARIDAVLARLAAEPVGDDELRKAKNQLRAEYVSGLKTVSGKANKLGFFQTVLGDYRALFRLEGEWEAVSAADVQRVAGTYLTANRRTVVVLVPLSARAPAAKGGGGK